MYMTNKYTKFYFAIIDKARNSSRSKSKDIYLESHHIIPRSLGGTNEPTNLVLLTVKEHYTCHRLLTKMVKGQAHINKMNYALYMFAKNSKGQDRHLTRHQLIKSLEANRSASQNRLHKPNLGNKHSAESRYKMAGFKGKTHTQETIDKIKESNKRTNQSRSQKVREANLNKPKSEEHKRKISEALKARKMKLVEDVGIEPTRAGM